MHLPIFRASIGLASCLFIGAHAQTPQAAPSPSGGIAGIVVDANNNSPIRRAIVTLSTMEAQPQDAVAWTDGNGRFSFGYLPAGRYQMRVGKDGYQAVSYGSESPRKPPAIIPLKTGELRSDFIFRLQLVTSISGVVLDDDGEPLLGVQVAVLRPGFQRHQRRLLPAGGVAMTDSNGHYRLTGLQPGQYVVVASHQYRPAARIHPEAVAGQVQAQYSYGVQYYPESDRGESASPISVQAGQEISGIDFRLVSRPIAFVRGKILLPPGATTVTDVSVSVSAPEEPGNRTNFGAGTSPPDYAFNFDQLQMGSYLLVAQATVDGRRYRGTQAVELGSTGLSDITIALEAGIDLAGSVTVEGPGAEKYSASFVTLVAGDGIPWNAPPLRANVNKDGSFKISGVVPGVWDINASPIPPGGYLKSMKLGDQDVLTEEMVIRSSTTALLKIVLATRAAAIEGDVAQEGEPQRVPVLLAPAGKFRHVSSFYRLVLCDEKGHFEIKNANPGDYQLYAFDEFDPDSIQDLELLKPFESAGVSVSLRDGPNTTAKLSVIRTNRRRAPEPR